MSSGNKIPVVDLFAGAGGLGEGFASFHPGGGFGAPFEIQLSVEKDPAAIKTLTLRKLFHYLRDNGMELEAYYRFLRGEMGSSADEFFDQILKSEEFGGFQDALISAEKRTTQLELKPSRDISLLEQKITLAIGNHKDWILIGGPPCQAYSNAGRSRKSDYREGQDSKHWLYQAYLGLLATFKPAAFIFENVPGVLSSTYSGGLIFDQILSDLRQPGDSGGPKYTIHSLTVHNESEWDNITAEQARTFIVKSERYGIPQKRHRVILFGIRTDLRIDRIPLLSLAPQEITVADAIRDCPRIRSGITRTKDNPSSWVSAVREVEKQPWLKGLDKNLVKKMRSASSRVVIPRKDRGHQHLYSGSNPNRDPLASWIHDKKLKGWITQHYSRAHMPSDLHRYFFASCFATVHQRSPKISELPRELLPDHRSAHGTTKSLPFSDRFKVQLQNDSASTITSHIAKDGHYYIHYDPTQCRSLTVREAARIQTFPDNFFFCGSRGDQYRQIGNAVPPFLALQIAKVVYQTLKYAGKA